MEILELSWLDRLQLAAGHEDGAVPERGHAPRESRRLCGGKGGRHQHPTPGREDGPNGALTCAAAGFSAENQGKTKNKKNNENQ